MFGRLRFYISKLFANEDKLGDDKGVELSEPIEISDKDSGEGMGNRKDNEKKYKQIINEYKKEMKEKNKESESADAEAKTGEFSVNADLLSKSKSSKKKVYKVKVNKNLENKKLKKKKKSKKHKKDEFTVFGKLPGFDESKSKHIKIYDNRELSWLKFNDRVLEEAEDSKNPLLERLSFVDIFRTNLDEFYRVRVGTLYDRTLVDAEKNKKDNKTGLTPEEQLKKIFGKTRNLLAKRDGIYVNLFSDIAREGLVMVSTSDLKVDEEVFLKRVFDAKIRDVLSPQIIGKKEPFPFLNHGETYVVALLEGKRNKNTEKICIMPCNTSIFTRLISMPSAEKKYVLVEDVILHFLQEIFDSYTVKSKALIRLIRNADIDVDEEFADEDLGHRDSMEKLIKIRKRLGPIMLQYRKCTDIKVVKTICKELGLGADQSFEMSTPLDTSFVFSLQDELRNRKELFFERRVPQTSRMISPDEKIMDQVKKKDILLSYPFDNIASFIKLLEEAGSDDSVVSIKMTLYRVAKNSQVVEALINAAENGKQVEVLVELRARFDEENNIEWSRRMEDAGCKIIYGIDYTKVHSKICLITYKDGEDIKHICQVGTGNYNEKTSKLYTDISLMTSDENIANEVDETFTRVSNDQVMEHTEHLLVAPKCLQNKVIEMIDEEIEHAKNGEEAYLGFKFNSLTDKAIIDKLIEASKAGVRIEMTIRGICCLIAGVPGFTENIRIQSIVGRYLEHSRIYIFGPEGRDKIYISSADFMTRNTLRRVEVACPIYDEKIKERIRDMFFIIMSDNVKARVMDEKGHYHKKDIEGLNEAEILNSQEYFFKESYGELE